jgi:hypothetical protein
LASTPVRLPPLLDLFDLTMTCTPFEQHLVIYLMTVAGRAIQLLLASKHEDSQTVFSVSDVINITQVAHLTLSLLINTFATSIIALKAWCVLVDGVFRKYFVECAFIDDDATCAYVQEIPPVADGKRNGYQNPWTGNQDIGCPG